MAKQVFGVGLPVRILWDTPAYSWARMQRNLNRIIDFEVRQAPMLRIRGIAGNILADLWLSESLG